MDKLNQIAIPRDVWESIPFATNSGLSIDAKVGLVCIACVIVVYLLKGF